jgi:hypothetical protein
MLVISEFFGCADRSGYPGDRSEQLVDRGAGVVGKAQRCGDGGAGGRATIRIVGNLAEPSRAGLQGRAPGGSGVS